MTIHIKQKKIALGFFTTTVTEQLAIKGIKNPYVDVIDQKMQYFVSNDSLFLSTCSTFTYISIYLPWSVITYKYCRQEKNLLCHFLHLSLFVFYWFNWTNSLTALFPDFHDIFLSLSSNTFKHFHPTKRDINLQFWYSIQL